MSHTILVDGNNIGIASHFANHTLVDINGRPTGGIYGFARSMRPLLARLIEETGTTDIKLVVLWDSGVNWRKEILPTYKASRHAGGENPELARYVDQVPRIHDLLTILGIGQLQAEGYEADDIAGHLCRIMPDQQITMITNDRDWLQLVGPNVQCWQPLKERYVNVANFEEVTSCKTVEEFVRLKALAGDKGDDVPGAAGVGEKTAISYLRGELSATTAAGSPAAKWQKADAWMNNPDGFDRSLKLVDLRDITVPSDRFRVNVGNFDEGALIGNLMELSFNSILGNMAQWISPFKAISVAKA